MRRGIIVGDEVSVSGNVPDRAVVAKYPEPFLAFRNPGTRTGTHDLGNSSSVFVMDE
jgi:hypothetical protein